MPGIYFDGSNIGDPDIRPCLWANSLSGTGTPPAADLLAGDVVCQTQKSTLTASGITVMRMLLAADVTAVYKEGTPVAGVYGIALDSARTNGSGQVTGIPAPGGISTGNQVIYPGPGGGGYNIDGATSRQYGRVAAFMPNQFYRGKLKTGTNATHALDGTLAGFSLSTSSGVTTYTIDPAATTKILRIVRPDEQDTAYNADAGVVIFQVLEAYCQALTGVVYSTQ